MEVWLLIRIPWRCSLQGTLRVSTYPLQPYCPKSWEPCARSKGLLWSFRMQFPVPITKDRQLPLSHACICTEEGTNCNTDSLFPLCVPSSLVTSSWCHQVAWWSHYDVIMMSSLSVVLDIDPPMTVGPPGHRSGFHTGFFPRGGTFVCGKVDQLQS